MGDINIGTDDDKAVGQISFYIFGLLIQFSICVIVRHEPISIDVILTNRKGSFKNIGTVGTGVSDYHKMVLTTMRRTTNNMNNSLHKMLDVMTSIGPLISELLVSIVANS